MIRLDRQQLIIGALALAVIVGFGIVAYYPLLCKARQVASAVQERREYIGRTDELVRRLVVSQAQLEGLQELRQRFDQRVPADKQTISELWGQIADVMKTHGLRDQLIRPGQETQSGRLRCNTISLECSGSLQQAFDFLQALDASGRLIRIESLELINDKGHSGHIRLVADARVYGQETAERGT